MRNHLLGLTTSAVILACSVAASAQAPGAQNPSAPQSPSTQPTPGGPMMQQQQDEIIRERLREQLQERAQRGEEEDSDRDDYRYRGGMMGEGPQVRGMMRRGYGYHDWDRGAVRPGMVGPPMMMRMIFSLMDADGDGKLSLQEFQAAHERIFKAMDANKDGFITLEEMQDFMRGTGRPASKQ